MGEEDRRETIRAATALTVVNMSHNGYTGLRLLIDGSIGSAVKRDLVKTLLDDREPDGQ